MDSGVAVRPSGSISYSLRYAFVRKPQSTFPNLPESPSIQRPPQKTHFISHAFSNFLSLFTVAIFGAGASILTLAILGLFGLKNLHEMNALKLALGIIMDCGCVFHFIACGLIHWREASITAVGMMTGGYAGACFAQKKSPTIRANSDHHDRFLNHVASLCERF